jgi:hypothetical protein
LNLFRLRIYTLIIAQQQKQMTEATLGQVKLTGEEWNGVEIMEPENEMRILKLIIAGFNDVNIVFNTHLSLFSRLKITNTPEMEDYLFDEYFKKRVERILADKGFNSVSKRFEITTKSKKPMKKADMMRMQNMNTTFGGSGDTYDHHIITTIEAMIETKNRNAAPGAPVVGHNEWMKHYYTLKLMLQKSVIGINAHIIDFANYIIDTFKDEVEIIGFLRNAYRFIEQNECVFKYADFQLYEHQKELFTIYLQQVKHALLNQKKPLV